MENFFSIICPMYNAENTIDRAVKSVLNQKYSNWEMILIDDGSTDLTKRKCTQYLSDKVKYFFQKNQGPSNARLCGISVANGEWFIFLDSDDYLSDNALLCLNDYLNKYNPQAIFFQENYEVDNELIQKELTSIEKIEYLSTNIEIVNRCFLHKDFGFGQCGGCFSKELYKKQEKKPYNFVNYRYCEDILDGYLLLKNAEKVLLIPDKLYTYVRMNNSLTHSLNGDDVFGQFEIFNYVFSDILFNKNVDKSRINLSFEGGLANALVKYIYKGSKFDSFFLYKKRVKIIGKDALVRDYLFKYGFSSKKIKLYIFLMRCRFYLLLYIISKFL